MPREAKPIVCYVTDRHAFSGSEPTATEALLEVIRRAITAGADWIQVREKNLATRHLVELTRASVAAAHGSAARILVNDRLDVALAAGAGGVHLGRESVPVAAVARWRTSGRAPQGILVGASCHSLAEAQQAELDAADYIFFGPVFLTPSKAAFGAPQGLERLAEVCQGVRIPVLAIGGISVDNASACLRAGAAGVAAIRLFQESPDLSAVVAELRATC